MGVKNVTCACSLGHDISVFTFRTDFELGGYPAQPPAFSSNSSKITKNAQFPTSVLTCWSYVRKYPDFFCIQNEYLKKRIQRKKSKKISEFFRDIFF